MSYIAAEQLYSEEMLTHANFYRSIALEVDECADNIKNYFDHSTILSFINDKSQNCLERTKQFEALAYGDPGVLLSAPGSSLAGQMIKELGNEEQNHFFEQYLLSHQTRTFLAVTEPHHGSDAANLETKIITSNPAKLYLHGEKCLVGNGVTGEIGVVVARTSPGPLGMVAVIIMPGQMGTLSFPDESIQRAIIPTVGLRGASLSHLVFDHYELTHEQVLGRHLRIANRGLMGLMKTFNRMRTCVGALAIGLSQAVMDYVYQEIKTLSISDKRILNELSHKINAARQILYQSAGYIDWDVSNGAEASKAKVIATKTAEFVMDQIINLLEVDVFWEHPLIEKWHRDVYGFEFMEGTKQIHYKNIANKFLTKKQFIYE